MIKIQRNVDLTSYNTFAVSCLAKEFAILRSTGNLEQLFFRQNPLFLGKGANTLLATSKLDRLVIKNETKGKKILRENTNSIVVEVASGETWHDFVIWCAGHNWSGIENLALIPGTVGGAVAGNIGAYGQTVSETVISVKIFPEEQIPNSACGFSYRESIFKNNSHYFITSATFEFQKTPYPPNHPQSPLGKAKEIITLRQSKLPNWEKIGTAGSFFKNPHISQKKLSSLLKEFPDMPYFPTSSGSSNSLVKIPAGYLLDKLGWRGKRIGRVGTWHQHALIVINYGGATGQEILEFTKQMQLDVEKKLGISLEPEVNIIT